MRSTGRPTSSICSKDLAPPPIVFGGALYLDRSDEAAFRSRLRLESLKRAADLAWQADVDRAERVGLMAVSRTGDSKAAAE